MEHWFSCPWLGLFRGRGPLRGRKGETGFIKVKNKVLHCMLNGRWGVRRGRKRTKAGSWVHLVGLVGFYSYNKRMGVGETMEDNSES